MFNVFYNIHPNYQYNHPPKVLLEFKEFVFQESREHEYSNTV